MTRVGELVASLPGLPGVGQDPVHGPLRGEVGAFVEQGGDHFRWGGVDEPGRVQHGTDGLAFSVRQGPRRPRSRAAGRWEGRWPPTPVERRPREPQRPAGLGSAKVGRDRLDGGHQVALCSSSLAGSSGMPSSSETFPWISMIFSAWARRVARRSFARRSRSTSTRVGSAGFRPRVRARAWSAPASRWRRQSTRWEEYSRSRRSNAPIWPGWVQRSASRRMASLYSALKRRRLAFSGTSGSGGLGIPPRSTLVRGGVIVTVMSWVLPLALVSEYRGWSVSAHAGREGWPASK